MNIQGVLGICLIILGFFVILYSIGIVSDIFGVVCGIPLVLMGFSLSFIFQKPKPETLTSGD